MSSFLLRALAVICMFVDHIGLALFPNIGAFRCVGRAAFPIFCFLLVQGFVHTRDARAYARRLLLFALLTEVPFDLLIFGRVASLVEQNAIFSLLLGLLALFGAKACERKPLPLALCFLAASMAAMILRVSFGWLGVALCLCFYLLQESRLRCAVAASAILLIYSLSLHLSGVTQSWVLVSLCSLFALAPILLYNGKRGARVPSLTFLFYAAYPLHMLLLVGVRAMRIVPPYFF